MIIKVLSCIFLSIYLIVSGLSGVVGFELNSFAMFWLNLSAVLAGIFMLISIGVCPTCHSDECNQGSRK